MLHHILNSLTFTSTLAPPHEDGPGAALVVQTRVLDARKLHATDASEQASANLKAPSTDVSG